MALEKPPLIGPPGRRAAGEHSPDAHLFPVQALRPGGNAKAPGALIARPETLDIAGQLE